MYKLSCTYVYVHIVYVLIVHIVCVHIVYVHIVYVLIHIVYVHIVFVLIVHIVCVRIVSWMNIHRVCTHYLSYIYPLRTYRVCTRTYRVCTYHVRTHSTYRVHIVYALTCTDSSICILAYTSIYNLLHLKWEYKSCLEWEYAMGWLRLAVPFAKEPYKRDYILQKRRIILGSL